MGKKILIHDAPFPPDSFTKEQAKAAIREARQEQYGGISEIPTFKPKDPHTEKEKELESKIKDLNARIDSQYKVIDKLVRDVKRLKDQISELAGRISRG